MWIITPTPQGLLHLRRRKSPGREGNAGYSVEGLGNVYGITADHLAASFVFPHVGIHPNGVHPASDVRVDVGTHAVAYHP